MHNNSTTNNSSITIINNNISNTDSSMLNDYAFTNNFNNNNINVKYNLQDEIEDNVNRSQFNKNKSFDDNFLLLQLSMSRTQFEQQPHNTQGQHQTFVENCLLSGTEEESFTCPQCFRTYRRHGTLRRHLRQECGKGKSMVCSVCGHRTKRADHLRQHVRKKHPEVAMRSLFRRVSFATTNVTATIPTMVTSSKTSSNSTPMRNILQQELEKSSTNSIKTGVAMNLATNRINDLQDIVDLDDDDDEINNKSNNNEDEAKSDVLQENENTTIENMEKSCSIPEINFYHEQFQHLQKLQQNENKTSQVSDSVFYNSDIATIQKKIETRNINS